MSDTFDYAGDAWDNLNFHGDVPWRISERKRLTCRHCKAPCEWANVAGKWRLYSKGEPHRCGIKDQFEDCA